MGRFEASEIPSKQGSGMASWEGERSSSGGSIVLQKFNTSKSKTDRLCEREKGGGREKGGRGVLLDRGGDNPPTKRERQRLIRIRDYLPSMCV